MYTAGEINVLLVKHGLRQAYLATDISLAEAEALSEQHQVPIFKGVSPKNPAYGKRFFALKSDVITSIYDDSSLGRVLGFYYLDSDYGSDKIDRYSVEVTATQTDSNEPLTIACEAVVKAKVQLRDLEAYYEAKLSKWNQGMAAFGVSFQVEITESPFRARLLKIDCYSEFARWKREIRNILFNYWYLETKLDQVLSSITEDNFFELWWKFRKVLKVVLATNLNQNRYDASRKRFEESLWQLFHPEVNALDD